MKRFLIIITGFVLFIQQTSAQRWLENFDGQSVSVTATPSTAWLQNSNYFVSSPNSYQGKVPHGIGSITYLETGPYDLRPYYDVYVRFSHICKISPNDIARIEYKVPAQNWQVLPTSAYLGTPSAYAGQQFSAASYSVWDANDNLAQPLPFSWWRDELFNVGAYVGREVGIQFRFVIVHGNISSTQIAYGWLIDNFEVIGSAIGTDIPIVEFQGTPPKDTIRTSGGDQITAKVKTPSGSAVLQPLLKWTTTFNGVSVTDSIPMIATNNGDTIWRANLPQSAIGTTLVYSVTGRERNGDYTTITSGYYVAGPPNAASMPLDSVKVIELVYPTSNTITPGIPNDIIVKIQNLGIDNLDSAVLYYQVNSDPIQSATWYGKLPWDFKSGNFKVGDFIPQANQWDTVKVWAENPNGTTIIVAAGDTIRNRFFGCVGPITGPFTLNPSPANNPGDINTQIAPILSLIQQCGMGSDVYILIPQASFTETWSIPNSINPSNTNGYKLVFRPVPGDIVTITPTTIPGISIAAGVSNIVLDSLTVNVSGFTTGTPSGIRFEGTATNVTIQNCRIMAPIAANNAATSAVTVAILGYGIFKTTSNAPSNILVTNNTVTGGYAGIRFDAGTGITIEENSVEDYASAGVYIANVKNLLIKNNSIKGRTTISQNITSHGIQINLATTGAIIGNKIQTRNSYPTSSGMNITGITINGLSNATDVSTYGRSLVANNEIIQVATIGTAAKGINVAGVSAVDIINNSIFFAGTATTNTGIGIGVVSAALTNANCPITIKNNLIRISSTMSSTTTYTATAIRLESNNFTNISLDNNLYCPVRLQHTSASTGIVTSSSTWQTVTGNDANSFFLAVGSAPTLGNAPNSLEITSGYSAYEVPSLPLVFDDINGNLRGQMTTVGCYEMTPASSINAAIMSIVGIPAKPIAGDSVELKAVVANLGTTPIVDITLGCSVGSTVLTNITKTVNLSKGGKDTVLLGKVEIPGGDFMATAWIEEIADNMGITLVDGNLPDDTLSTPHYGCDGNYIGNYNVGGINAHFASLTEARFALQNCDVIGDIILELADGEYTDASEWNFSSFKLPGNRRLTITAQAGDSVIVKPNTGTEAIRIAGNSSYITFEGITIDVRTGTRNAVLLTGDVTNITFNNCYVYGSTAGGTGTDLFYKEQGTGSGNGGSGNANNIRITNCRLEGGRSAIDMHVGNSALGNEAYITVNRNLCINNHAHGIRLHSFRGDSVCYNIIQSKESGSATDWKGITLGNTYTGVPYLDGSGFVSNNKILQRSTNITNPCGIEFIRMNSQKSGNTPLLNNEIILPYATDANAAGIRLRTSRAIIQHNSIYIGGSAAAKGIHINFNDIAAWGTMTDPSPQAFIKGNNIRIEGTGGHPLYFNQTTNIDSITPAYKAWIVGNNNYSAPTYMGYFAGVSVNASDWTTWRTFLPLDGASVDVVPSYSNVNTSLKLRNYVPFETSKLTDFDIDDEYRYATTAMGCYTIDITETKVLLEESNWDDKVVLNMGQPIDVKITNASSTPLDSLTLDYQIEGGAIQTYSWTTGPTLTAFAWHFLHVDIFPVPADPTEVKVWVSSVNNQPYIADDTLTMICYVVPMGNWVDTLSADDTISEISFDVYAEIFERSGATAVSPQIEVTCNNNTTMVTMHKNAAGLWTATIPVIPSYYNKWVYYSLTLTDTVGNPPFTLLDSTFIEYAIIPGLQTELRLVEFLEEDILNDYCSYKIRKIVVENTGMDDHNYFLNNVVLHVNVGDPVFSHDSMVFRQGILAAGEKDTIDISHLFPVTAWDSYKLGIWLDNAISAFLPTVDTLDNEEYVPEILELPINIDFESGSPRELLQDNSGASAWNIVPTGTLLEHAGSQTQHAGDSIIAFNGNRGTMVALYTRPLGLHGMYNPRLEFWYFHDTVSSSDYMDIYITQHTNVFYVHLTTLYKQSNVYGWKQYSIDLSNYTNGSCMSVLFEAMSMSAGVTQYIDDINIASQQEIEVSEIYILPQITSACDLSNREVYVVLRTTTNQRVDFSQSPTNIAVKIPGYSTPFNTGFNTGLMAGDSSYTFKVASGVNFTTGTHNLTAYLSIPIDSNRKNDTARLAININPSLSVTIPPTTNEIYDCVRKGSINPQKIWVKNTGNIALSGIAVQMEISVQGMSLDMQYDTIHTTILPNDSAYAEFSYTAPTTQTEKFYFVDATISMICDLTLANAQTSVRECVDMDDLYLIDSLIKPQGAEKKGESKQIEVWIVNASSSVDYSNVTITARIEDENGTLINGLEFIQSIPNIDPLDTTKYTFSGNYTVPDVSKYYIRVFLSSKDVYPENDTIRKERNPQTVGIYKSLVEGFTLEQNIPNPANNRTKIGYSIPASGEVIFNVQSVTGQILYTKVLQSEEGKHVIDLNTNDFAAGIYFYSIEYQGQKLLKRMSVKN